MRALLDAVPARELITGIIVTLLTIAFAAFLVIPCAATVTVLAPLAGASAFLLLCQLLTAL